MPEPGSLPRGGIEMPGSTLTPEEIATAEELAKAQKELSWQLTRMGVDAATIVDPTGLSNIPAMGMAIYDGDFISAGLSLIGLIPLLGKASDIAKEARMAERAAELSKTVAALTTKLRNLGKLRKEVQAAEEVAKIGKEAAELKEAKTALQEAEEALAAAKKTPGACVPCAEKKLAEAQERALSAPAASAEREVIGDPGNPYERNQLATKFYKEHGKPGESIMSHRDGIDTSKPVVVKRLEPGDKVVRWEFPGSKGKDVYVTHPGENPETLGIEMTRTNHVTGLTESRVPVTYEITKPTEVLESTAADVGKLAEGVGGKGGGKQIWLPDSSVMVKK